MKFKSILLILFICSPLLTWAQNWDYIKNSDEYYYGVGKGVTVKDADEMALSALVSQIATNVSSDFIEIDEETTSNGNIDHKSRVLNCVKTYSQATLTNTQRWVVGKEPNVVVRRYMKKSELQRIFQGRIERAKDMVIRGDECLVKRKIDMALEYYYHAYSLIRSIQYPNEVKNENGEILVNVLPIKIRQILKDISVEFEEKDGEFVKLRFLYDGKPVSSMAFTYNDGRSDKCMSDAKDGYGTLDMAAGYENKKVFSLEIEYEYKEQARGDDELESVMNVISKKVFPEAGFKVESKGTIKPIQRDASDMTVNKGVQHAEIAENPITPAPQAPVTSPTSMQKEELGMNLTPKESQVMNEAEDYAEIMVKVIEAARTRSLGSVDRYFTIDGGLPRYRMLLKMGAARVVGTPNITFFKGAEDNHVVARGLQMSLTYNSRGRKKTFVEDVVFTFNADKKIENVTFGLGQVATNDILCKHPGWNDQTKELLMEFLENYKTAYCMKDSVYIRQIFADDAIIIVGNVVRKATNNGGFSNNHEHPVSLKGQEIIRYNRYDKDTYLKNLRKCFDRNEFINLKFSRNDIQHLEKFQDREIFGIQIGQEYSSSTYSDEGFLYLLADLTDHSLPQINVRAWQPREVPLDSLFHSGYFYGN